MGVDKVCEYCGASFVDRSSGQVGRYCSKRCGQRAWNKANPEKVAASKRAYYKANREREVESSRTYREANREKEATRVRVYYEANREKQLANKRAWKKANPEKVREYQARRHALKKDVLAKKVDYKAIFKRDDYICQLCRKSVDMGIQYPDPMSASIDHILPLSRGGTHEPRNVQLTHLRCNLKKKNRVAL